MSDTDADSPDIVAQRADAGLWDTDFRTVADSPRTFSVGIRNDLPAELWGEIARFSLREDILNLRSTSTALKAEAEVAVSTMTLVGRNQLRAFTDAECFNHLTALRLVDIDDDSLYRFATHWVAHPRNDLTLEIENSYRGVARGLDALRGASIAVLCLHNVYLTDSVVTALERCCFPIALSGYFCADEFVSATRLPTLRTLISPSTEFDDAVAQLVSRHRALEVLSLHACDNLTSRGIAALAQMSTLRMLSVDERYSFARPIDPMAARALAASPTLKSLSIPSSMEAPSAETFSNLSKSSTLEVLEISVCDGMQCLADMVLLEQLTLSGSRGGPSISTEVARIVTQLPNLQMLQLSAIGFAAGALRTILEGCRAKNIVLQKIALHRDDVAALFSNRYVKVLAFVNVSVSQEWLPPLFQHPTLERFTIDGQ